MSDHSANDETRLAFQDEGVMPGSVSAILQPSTGYPAVGDILHGRFRLEAELGRGGMGIVYKALDFRRQEAEDREPYVAVKILNPDLIGDPLFLRALQRECKRSQNLPHPNIITVFDFDRDGRNVFMTMEYLEGKTFKQIIQECRQGMRLGDSWPWIRDMASALSYAHLNGIVHSDFKPGNVFLAKGGVKVLDFGLASLVSKNQDHDRTLVDARSLGAYTPCYASLETLRNESVDPADDLFAFACTVYELLSGQHPFHRLTALQAKDARVKPRRLESLTPRQWRALEQGLALSRGDRRKTSVSQLAAELDPNRHGNRSAVVAGFASVTIIVTIGLGLFWLGGETKHMPPTPLPTPTVAPRPEPTALPERISPTPTPTPEPATIGRNPEIESAVLARLGQNMRISEDGVIAAGIEHVSYRIGDTLTVRFAVVAPRYVYVLYLNSQDEIARLYPNRQQTDGLTKANRLIAVPPQGKTSFVLRIAKPVGRDRIVIFASNDMVHVPEALIKGATPADTARVVLELEVVR